MDTGTASRQSQQAILEQLLDQEANELHGLTAGTTNLCQSITGSTPPEEAEKEAGPDQPGFLPDQIRRARHRLGVVRRANGLLREMHVELSLECPDQLAGTARPPAPMPGPLPGRPA
jgi:hypothetical protein